MLRGLYSKYDLDPSGIPLSVTAALAQHAHHTIDSVDKWNRIGGKKPMGKIAFWAAYSEHLQFCAIVLSDIVLKRIDLETAELRHPKILAIVISDGRNS